MHANRNARWRQYGLGLLGGYLAFQLLLSLGGFVNAATRALAFTKAAAYIVLLAQASQLETALLAAAGLGAGRSELV